MPEAFCLAASHVYASLLTLLVLLLYMSLACLHHRRVCAKTKTTLSDNSTTWILARPHSFQIWISLIKIRIFVIHGPLHLHAHILCWFSILDSRSQRIYSFCRRRQNSNWSDWEAWPDWISLELIDQSGVPWKWCFTSSSYRYGKLNMSHMTVNNHDPYNNIGPPLFDNYYGHVRYCFVTRFKGA